MKNDGGGEGAGQVSGVNKWIFNCVEQPNRPAGKLTKHPKSRLCLGIRSKGWLEEHLQGCQELQRLSCFCGKANR